MDLRLSATRTLLALALTFIATSASAQSLPAATEPLIVGTNVNMVGGLAVFTPPSTLTGDPFLQRQNEPSLAVSSRNPCHLLAGANDYRAVDLEEAVGEVGDAWLGLFKSFDCGSTWTSTLLPGHPVDDSADGLASPLRGLQAAADATVRAGTSGLFYYSGIAFNRAAGGLGKVFVARFVDNNNKDGGDPIQYLGTVQIDTGTSGQFLDKPWIVADIPRGDATCVINGRTVPAGNVYLVYTSFLGDGANVHSKILFSRSTDCGATWSNPAKLSERFAKNQGTTIAIDPGTGAIHIAWREFALANDSKSLNALLVTSSTDGGRSFTKATRIAPDSYQFSPFDQASTPLTFRTNAYPTLAIVPAEADGRAAGQPGRVYVAWSARGFAPLRPGQALGDARVVVSTSVGGQAWSYPQPADNYPGAGHQIMPTLAFAGGKLALAWYDLREDRSLGFDDLALEYGQASYNACMASHGGISFAAVLSCIMDTANTLSLTRRHTLDLRSAMADSECLGNGTCAFTTYSVLGGGSRRVSRYIEGFASASLGKQQLQYNRPNLPLFSKGRYPFIGDYIDIAGLNFVTTPDGQWVWNTGRTANRPAPVFHVSWADNRNVGTPRNKNWEQFTPAVVGPNFVQCVPGQVGIRNQDIYTAQLKPQLSLSAPLNSKRVVGLQRSFVVVAQNATSVEREYVLTVQPPPGVIASFNQFLGFDGNSTSTSTLSVRIPRKSTISRTVFVALADAPADPNNAPDILVPVNVAEVALGSGGGTLTGITDVVYLNPDFENPDFENPDFENTELHNPDFENPDFENPDFENPDFENPDFENPDFENFTLSAASAIRNPDFENPDFENPDFENPDFENPDFENPDFENPDFENPDFENPDFENPDFENPDFENPDFENGAFEVADTTFPVRNDGNTTSAYKANVQVADAPAGVRYQLVVRRVAYSPASVCAVPATGSPAYTAQNQALVNIVGADVQANLFDRNFNDPSPQNATFYLAPGERASITLRAYCEVGVEGCDRPLMAALEGKTALSVIAQGANCVACTGPACSLGDSVGGGTECSIGDGPAKDLFDPIAPEIAVVAPTFSNPETTVVATDNDNNGSEPVTVLLTATDNVGVANVQCSVATTTVGVQSLGNGTYQLQGVFPLGNNAVDCTASDLRELPSPNNGSVHFIVDVRDVTPPSFGSPAFSFSNAPNGANGWYTIPSVTGSVNVTDSTSLTIACTDSLAGTTVAGTAIVVAGEGVHTIACTATDSGELSASATSEIKIDSTAPAAPTLIAPAATNGWYTAPVPFTVQQGTDASGISAVTCTIDGQPVAQAAEGFTVTGDGTRTIACSVTNGAGLTSDSATNTIRLDTVAPTLNAPANRVVEATSAAGAVVHFDVTANDALDTTPTLTCTHQSGATFPIGTTSVSCTAADDAGNTRSASFDISVGDTTGPSFVSIASDLTVEATSAAGAVVTYAAATVTDLTDASPDVTCVPSSGSAFALGQTTVTCTARDDANNTTTRSFTVTVRDTTAPVVTVPANLTNIVMTMPTGAVVSYVATATDVVSGTLTPVCAPASGSVFPAGTTQVTCTATDAAGNQGSGSFTVSVADLTPPTSISVSGITPALLWPPDGRTVNVAVSGTAFDGQSGVARIEWRVIDEYGTHQPSGFVTVSGNGPFIAIVPLVAERKGNDKDGRHYTIVMTALDKAGNRTQLPLAQSPVVNVHDQSTQ